MTLCWAHPLQPPQPQPAPSATLPPAPPPNPFRPTAGDSAAARLPLPETLRLDAASLHAAQNEFQRVLVTATCLLLVRQAAPAGQVRIPAWWWYGMHLCPGRRCRIRAASPPAPLPPSNPPTPPHPPTSALLPLSYQAFGAAEVATGKARLSAVLADPSARLPDIAAECARLAVGAGGQAGAAREQAMQASLQRMLSRSAGALKASLCF